MISRRERIGRPIVWARKRSESLFDASAESSSPDDDDEGSLLLDDELNAELGLNVDDEEETVDEDDEDEDDEDDEEEEGEAGSLEELLQMGQMSDGSDSLRAEWERRGEEVEVSIVKEEAREAKRRKKTEEIEAFEEERGIGFLIDDPVCRAVVACVTTGSDADNETVARLEAALKERCGPRVVVAHHRDPEPEVDFPVFEVWIEGYRHFVLHSRNWHQEGDLTDEKMEKIVDLVENEVCDDAKDILGTYTDEVI